MNDWDRNNLQFLFSLDEKGLADWVKTVEADDVAYAFELLATARNEFILQGLEIIDQVEDLSAASEILSTFTLKGSK